VASGGRVPVEECETVDGCLRQIDFLDEEIAEVEGAIATDALGSPEIKRLMTVPGVNVIVAATFLAASRARRVVGTGTLRIVVAAVASGGLWPCSRSSCGSRLGGRISMPDESSAALEVEVERIERGLSSSVNALFGLCKLMYPAPAWLSHWESTLRK
jgi:transposase